MNNSDFLLNIIKQNKYAHVNKIESIINNDRKDASYKFALIRAFCDISEKDFNSVIWDGNVVKVPVSLIVEYWIIYYWSLIDNEFFIPQKRGESLDSNKKIAFRSDLKDLCDKYKDLGGLNGFYNDLKNNNVQYQKLYNKLKSKVRTTIIKGPIDHSGTGFNIKPFQCKEDFVIIDKDLWVEISVLNYFIKESLLLRWAQFTFDISNGDYDLGFVLNLLLKNPCNERDVFLSRKTFDSIKDVICVWSQTNIKKYDVDHIIPFSLWKNNDLWNLLPVRPDINNRKRDYLPSADLMNKSKDLIIYYWELLNKNNSIRFLIDINKFNGYSKSKFLIDNWENITFDNLKFSIEYTAIQRGWKRFDC